MRYAQGGELAAERREFRERIGYQAGERFTRGEKTAVIAKDLRVSEWSVERWRRAWREGGMDALASIGPSKLPRLSGGQFAESEEELTRGPAEHGWEDRRWTLAPDQSPDRLEIPDRLFDGGGMAAAAPTRLVLEVSRPPRAETRRAYGRAVEEGSVAAGGMTAAALGAFIVFEDGP